MSSSMGGHGTIEDRVETVREWKMTGLAQARNSMKDAHNK